MEVAVFFLCSLLALLVYKVLDRLVRWPTIGSRSARSVFITGCDTGFGNLLARRLDSQGVQVFAGCLTEKGETDLRKQCSSRLKTVQLNVAKHESVVKAMEFVKGQLLPTGKGLWGLVNNAGIGSKIGPIDWCSLPDYQRVLDVNTMGVVDVATTFLPLIKKERGRIVNMSSGYGRCTGPIFTIYCMSKFAVEAFSDTLRRQMRCFGVSVHIVEPGVYGTAIISHANINQQLKAAYDEADPEVREAYGEQYIKTVQKVVFDESIGKLRSARLDDVIDVYEHALFGMFPRGRYVVGWVSAVLIAVDTLPEWLSDWIIDVPGGFSKLRPAAAV